MRNMAGRLGRGSVALVTAAVVLATGGTGVGAQEVPPVVPPTVQVEEDGAYVSSQVYRDCDGTDIDVGTFGGVSFLRDGTEGDLEVEVGYSGSLAASLVGPAPTAMFYDGEDVAGVSIELPTSSPGDLTVTIAEPSTPGAYLVGEPASITIEVPGEESVLDCNDPIGLDELATPQTIRVGETPDPFGIYSQFFFGDDDVPEEEIELIAAYYSTPVAGSLPPGLAYDDDTWTGATTVAGTYSFGVRLCYDVERILDDEAEATEVDLPRVFRSVPSDRAIEDLPPEVCLGTEQVEVEVLAALPAVTPARPATPVTGPARFTG